MIMKKATAVMKVAVVREGLCSCPVFSIEMREKEKEGHQRK